MMACGRQFQPIIERRFRRGEKQRLSWVRGTGDHTVITLRAKLHRFEIGRLIPCVEPVVTLFHQRYLQ